MPGDGGRRGEERRGLLGGKQEQGVTNGGGRAKFRSVGVATRSDIKTTPGRVPAPGSPPSIYICVYKIDGTPEDCGLCKDYEVLPAESRFLFFTKNHLYSPLLSFPPSLSLYLSVSLYYSVSPTAFLATFPFAGTSNFSKKFTA